MMRICQTNEYCFLIIKRFPQVISTLSLSREREAPGTINTLELSNFRRRFLRVCVRGRLDIQV